MIIEEQQIIEFINSEDKILKFSEMLPIKVIEDILVRQGFNGLDLNGDETNGWQVDFWYNFNHPEKGKYTLSGSLHYGDFTLTKK